MRVLFVNRPNALEQPGGDLVQMRETARGLRGLGFEVEERLGVQDEGELAGFDLVQVFNLQTPEFTLGEVEKAKRAGRKVALSTIYWDFGAELLLAASPKWRKIASLVGPALGRRLAQRRVETVAAADRAQMARILELADVWLPNSRAEVAHLERLTSVWRRVEVVPNGIDPVRFDPERSLALPSWATESKGYLLVAARIDGDKNQVPFCRALAGSGIPIVLAGKGSAELIRECEAAGAQYVGPLEGDDLVAAYAHARVHALPSFRETPGLASLEAAAMGCAIVSTEAGSAREYFEGDAEYCDARSAESMRRAVERAWERGPVAGLSAKVRSRYTWSAAAAATRRAYEAI